MNKLIIIGNGFDLAHGLKTSYSDFILWHLNEVLKEYKKDPSIDTELIKLNFVKTNPRDNFSSLKELKEIIDKGYLNPAYKHNFFEKIINETMNNELNWVDIERKYYESILSISLDFQKKNDSVYIQSAKELNECFESIKKSLTKYLASCDITSLELDDEIYFNLFGSAPSDQLRILNGGDKTLVLNFNYTSVIEKYLNKYRENNGSVDVIHIHGQLDNTANPIIFGYGDYAEANYQIMESLIENEFLKNMKLNLYALGQNYRKLFRFLNQARFQVSILGHSCGISDKVLLNNIFEHDNCESIKVFYHQKSENENDFNQKVIQISRHFKHNEKHKMNMRVIPSGPLKKYVKL